ncbi:MAG: NADH-quinone oxidoreductase subunit N [Anaerolinea sp.]|nr:NADH-quinone oxidoreductase subunit N [Anaerolinea sp.]
MTVKDFLSLLPHTVLLVWASLLLLVDLFIPKNKKAITAMLAGSGLLITFILVLRQWGGQSLAYHQMVVVDNFAVFLNGLFALTGIVSILIAYDYLNRMSIQKGEYYVLLLFSVSGMMLMASAADLIMVFLALELLSIPLYILSALAIPRSESAEAALKYFILGAFAAGFVLYGTALIFGATQNTALVEIVAKINAGGLDTGLLIVGAGLLLVGFSFKVAAVPFHMWTPDVYQGAPSPVTGFMSIGAKAAGFAALIRVFTLALPSFSAVIAPLFAVMAALTMIVGNVAAVSQSNIKRMLAYSSIAHAGYILMALVPYANPAAAANATASALMYLVVYGLTSLGAWAVISAVEKVDGGDLGVHDYSGLGKRHPWLAAAMTVFMLSFTGVPPLIGFWGKFFLFRTAIEGGYVLLAIIGLLTSLISAWYYLRVIVMMYFRDGEVEASKAITINVAAVGLAVLVLLIGLLPTGLFNLALQALANGMG